MITIQKYVRATSLEEAWTLNQAKANRSFLYAVQVADPS